MEVSHYESDLDPSSVLGFGSALTILDSKPEVARLLTGALRSMELADLQAVVLATDAAEKPRVYGSVGTRSLSNRLQAECRRATEEVARDGREEATPSQQQVDVTDDRYPALVEEGIRRLVVVRLASIDDEFGFAIAGLREEMSHTPMDASTLQMLSAQVSMALHRIDLDEEQSAQHASLEASEARYRELYESAPVAYVSVTPEAEMRMVNAQAADLFDASEEALVGRSILNFCGTTEAGRKAAERLERCLQTGEVVRDEELELCRPGGDRVWVSLTMRPLEQPEHAAERLVMMVDVTERKKMETELREARSDLETRVQERTAELEQANARLKQQAKRLKALRDVDRAILAAESPDEIATVAARRVQDVVPCERVSVSLFDWEADEFTVLAAQQDGSILEQGGRFPIGSYYLTDALRRGEVEDIPDFTEMPSTPITERLRDAGIESSIIIPMVVEGELTGALNLGATRKHAFDDQDRRAGRELADHLAIALRQARLLKQVQEQTERLEERVQERTEELESFTYSVSHDLRTPLRAIDGYSRILREEYGDQLDEEGQRLLGVVCESADKMGDLIDDLLTLSRLGRREMSRAPIDMEALVQEAFDELKRARPETAVNLEIGSLPDAVGDRSMIRHALTNLLSNAIKFTQEEETPEIQVTAEERGVECVFAIRDNGVGFSMEYADKLFGVFQRLHEDDEFEGTGVGLALVERILRRHEEEVWAEGAEGKGATFYFTLPRANGA